MSNTTPFTQAEIKKIQDDPEEFFRKVLFVPDGALIGHPLEPNYVQREIIKSHLAKKRCAICVHRRAGKSIAVIGLALWHAFTKAGCTILIICPGESHVSNLFRMMRVMLDLNPALDAAVKAFKRSSSPKEVVFNNGSRIEGFTTGAKTQGEGISIRGRSADLIILDEAAYLNEADFAAIKPIYTGDMYRTDIRLLAASTLNQTQNTFYEWIDKPLKDWDVILIPVDKNPDIPPEMIREWRQEFTEHVWDVEFLCKLNLVGAGVFRESYVKLAQRKGHFYVLAPTKKAIRTIGVDWNKFLAGTHIVVTEMDRDTGKYWVVLREEIPRSMYTLSNAVERLIELNTIFKPHFIYIDEGYGEMQHETLHKYGVEHPESGLHNKVKQVNFGSKLTSIDPFTKEEIRRPLKQVMMNVAVKIFEDQRIIIPESDKILSDSLLSYKVKEVTSTHIKFSEERDHAVDALALSLWAMHENFDDPFRRDAATNTYFFSLADVGKKSSRQSPDLFKNLIPVTEINKPRRQSIVGNTGGRIGRVSLKGDETRTKL